MDQDFDQIVAYSDNLLMIQFRTTLRDLQFPMTYFERLAREQRHVVIRKEAIRRGLLNSDVDVQQPWENRPMKINEAIDFLRNGFQTEADGIDKSKQEITEKIAALDEMASMIEAEKQAAHDLGVQEGIAKVSGPGDKIYSEADLDAALAQLRAEIESLKAQLAEALAADAKTPFDQAHVSAAVDTATAEISAKLESLKIANAKKEELLAQVQASLGALLGSLTPAQPEPMPEPEPEIPSEPEMPSEPEQPAQPEEPMPEIPAEPEQPAPVEEQPEVEAPVEPELPAEPETPVEAEEPKKEEPPVDMGPGAPLS